MGSHDEHGRTRTWGGGDGWMGMRPTTTGEYPVAAGRLLLEWDERRGGSGSSPATAGRSRACSEKDSRAGALHSGWAKWRHASRRRDYMWGAQGAKLFLGLGR